MEIFQIPRYNIDGDVLETTLQEYPLILPSVSEIEIFINTIRDNLRIRSDIDYFSELMEKVINDITK
jgi:hypothetical protein